MFDPPSNHSSIQPSPTIDLSFCPNKYTGEPFDGAVYGDTHFNDEYVIATVNIASVLGDDYGLLARRDKASLKETALDIWKMENPLFVSNETLLQMLPHLAVADDVNRRNDEENEGT
jgi:hypothetical protein